MHAELSWVVIACCAGLASVASTIIAGICLWVLAGRPQAAVQSVYATELRAIEEEQGSAYVLYILRRELERICKHDVTLFRENAGLLSSTDEDSNMSTIDSEFSSDDTCDETDDDTHDKADANDETGAETDDETGVETDDETDVETDDETDVETVKVVPDFYRDNSCESLSIRSDAAGVLTLEKSYAGGAVASIIGDTITCGYRAVANMAGTIWEINVDAHSGSPGIDLNSVALLPDGTDALRIVRTGKDGTSLPQLVTESPYTAVVAFGGKSWMLRATSTSKFDYVSISVGEHGDTHVVKGFEGQTTRKALDPAVSSIESGTDCYVFGLQGTVWKLTVSGVDTHVHGEVTEVRIKASGDVAKVQARTGTIWEDLPADDAYSIGFKTAGCILAVDHVKIV